VLVNSFLPDYPFSARPTFRLLRKLDFMFTSLLLGEDAETGRPLSGFENRATPVVSTTEKVRIKCIAETCRVVVVEAREQEDGTGGYDDEEEGEEDDDDDMFGTEDPRMPGKWEMEAARVYERTIQLLGDELGKQGEFCDPSIGAGEGCLP
jgi:hypothetical protein